MDPAAATVSFASSGAEFSTAVTTGNTSKVPGISSPDGYVILEYYQYNLCQGELQEKRAMALGECVPSGLRGEPYFPAMYCKFTNNSEGWVDANLYDDSECLQFREIYETFYYNNCSTSGDSILYTFSAKLPQFTIDYASVEQVVYSNSTSDDAADVNCDILNQTVLSYSLYSSTCRQNCFFIDNWEYCTFDSCENATANVTYFEQTHAGPFIPCDNMDKLGYQVFTSSCNDRITCYDPNNFLPADGTASHGDNDDDNLSGVVVAVIVVGSLVVLLAVGAMVVMHHRRSIGDDDGTSIQKTELNEPLTGA